MHPIKNNNLKIERYTTSSGMSSGMNMKYWFVKMILDLDLQANCATDHFLNICLVLHIHLLLYS